MHIDSVTTKQHNSLLGPGVGASGCSTLLGTTGVNLPLRLAPLALAAPVDPPPVERTDPGGSVPEALHGHGKDHGVRSEQGSSGVKGETGYQGLRTMQAAHAGTDRETQNHRSHTSGQQILGLCWCGPCASRCGVQWGGMSGLRLV